MTHTLAATRELAQQCVRLVLGSNSQLLRDTICPQRHIEKEPIGGCVETSKSWTLKLH